MLQDRSKIKKTYDESIYIKLINAQTKLFKNAYRSDNIGRKTRTQLSQSHLRAFLRGATSNLIGGSASAMMVTAWAFALLIL